MSLPKLVIMEAVRDPAIATHLVGLATPEQVGAWAGGRWVWQGPEQVCTRVQGGRSMTHSPAASRWVGFGGLGWWI